MGKVFEIIGEFAVYAIILIGAIALLASKLAELTSF